MNRFVGRPGRPQQVAFVATTCLFGICNNMQTAAVHYSCYSERCPDPVWRYRQSLNFCVGPSGCHLSHPAQSWCQDSRSRSLYLGSWKKVREGPEAAQNRTPEDLQGAKSRAGHCLLSAPNLPTQATPGVSPWRAASSASAAWRSSGWIWTAASSARGPRA